MGVEIKLDYQAIANIEKAMLESAEVAMEAVKTDVINSATMPFDTGIMQNGGTYENTNVTVIGNDIANSKSNSEIHICLTNDAPQARRLYYHPEYNFQQGKNANAGAGWLEDYVNGNKRDFAQTTFESEFKKRSGV